MHLTAFPDNIQPLITYSPNRKDAHSLKNRHLLQKNYLQAVYQSNKSRVINLANTCLPSFPLQVLAPSSNYLSRHFSLPMLFEKSTNQLRQNNRLYNIYQASTHFARNIISKRSSILFKCKQIPANTISLSCF